MKIHFSIILPCFNESDNIIELYNELLNLEIEGNNAEIIFVNNGSTDDTEEKIDKIINTSFNTKNLNFFITKLNLKNNLGYGGGIVAGLKIAKGECIGWTHADLQTPLNDFCKLYNTIKDKKKFLAKGSRVNNRGFDSLVTKMHEIFSKTVLGENMTEINAQPKIIHRTDLHYFDNPPTNWTTLDTYFYYIALKNNFDIFELNVIFKERIFGQSKWKNNFFVFIKHLYHNFTYLFKLRLINEKNNSTKPSIKRH